MTETKTLDIADFLVGGTAHRLRKTVEVYRDANLAAEIEAWEKRQADPEQAGEGMDSLGDHTADPSLDEALLARIEASKAEISVFALIDTELKEVEASLGEKPAGYQYVKDMSYWYGVFAKAATIKVAGGEETQLTAEQWALVHQTIGAQFTKLTQAYLAAASTEVDPRFRGRGTNRPQ